jgi:hypothetical protein
MAGTTVGLTLPAAGVAVVVQQLLLKAQHSGTRREHAHAFDARPEAAAGRCQLKDSEEITAQLCAHTKRCVLLGHAARALAAM